MSRVIIFYTLILILTNYELSFRMCETINYDIILDSSSVHNRTNLLLSTRLI